MLPDNETLHHLFHLRFVDVMTGMQRDIRTAVTPQIEYIVRLSHHAMYAWRKFGNFAANDAALFSDWNLGVLLFRFPAGINRQPCATCIYCAHRNFIPFVCRHFYSKWLPVKTYGHWLELAASVDCFTSPLSTLHLFFIEAGEILSNPCEAVQSLRKFMRQINLWFNPNSPAFSDEFFAIRVAQCTSSSSRLKDSVGGGE